MPMPSRYRTDELLDHALRLFADGGLDAVSISGLSRASGAPSGSLYHRFDSRDGLVAALWLRTVERFQEGYLDALAHADADAAAHAAVGYVLAWVRARPAEGLLLSRHGATDVLVESLQDDLVARLTSARERLEDAIGSWRARHPRRPSGARARFALVDLPYGAVRPYLSDGRAVPAELDAVVDDALRAALA